MTAGFPESAIRLATYAELETFVRAFAAGSFNLLVLLGAPGLQKSRSVREALPDACWIEGHATALGIYTRLWEHRDEPVIIDDVDSLYSNPGAVRLLKCLCQTERRKTVAWESDAPALRRDNIPKRFPDVEPGPHHRQRLADTERERHRPGGSRPRRRVRPGRR